MVLFPVILYLASIGTSLGFIVLSSLPGSTLNTHMVEVMSIPNWVLSLSLNIIVAFLISGRLMYYRHKLRDALGKHHVRHYTTIAALVVESAALYAVFALITLVVFALNNALENTFIPILGVIQVSLLQLIEYPF